jgi:pimeloyl-ACP methyl ester carboxylesterase
MTTYVLVHGAWAGAHVFRPVRPLLRQAGHEVFTPSMTGIGERVHLTGPQVTLSTHVQDVVHHVLYEDLDDVVLLGFSYGGMVVSGALDRLAERVRHLVFLDAFVPADGQSLADLAGIVPDPSQLGEAWTVEPRRRQLEDPAAQAWQEVRRTPQPVRTFTEPVRMAVPLEERGFPLTYLKATADPDEDPGSAFWRHAEHARGSDRWGYHEIESQHSVPLARPKELADLLLTL